ncbi:MULTISPECIES: ABC transporter substrate-binding protein [unclassified Streptomyces]|uniref:ABC transporter substrate-binding protein n=1 Tax=unclassified Streptomyces TaxID=2593676 RepID=UPI0029BAB707|nr:MULTISPECIES: ABC transporter substrate-binding protein [unclassified Streptomyces]MDX2729804.1 ABC transporter substrate-binding protein [Streptomyces sp. PA03-2a]MDX3768454.1 ABC transporter substrate-binding protein [Streptomyces sp. AK08-01B]MDX3817785.1 ABC transporter substrate-binding protein [Streptomyces sp. AK08-01A]
MREQTVWQFSDDRGQLSAAERRPSKVLAYVQAGATLWDYGIHPWGIFGSGHDGDEPDRAKTGFLPLTEVEYLGAGGVLDVETLLRGEPDLVVAVSYGGGHVYGLAPETAKHLEEHVPVVVVDVGQARTLADIGNRFAELARSLGAEETPTTEDLAAARDRLRTLTAGPSRPRVLALSPAGQDQAHLARPRMWPELRVLTELGVDVLEPPTGPGANWSTVGWPEVTALRPGILLTDVRSNATPLDRLRSAPEQAAAVVPWNPEPICSPRAHARFLTLVADAVEAAQGS